MCVFGQFNVASQIFYKLEVIRRSLIPNLHFFVALDFFFKRKRQSISKRGREREAQNLK